MRLIMRGDSSFPREHQEHSSGALMCFILWSQSHPSSERPLHGRILLFCLMRLPEIIPSFLLPKDFNFGGVSTFYKLELTE